MKKVLLQKILDNSKKGIFVYQDHEYKFVNKKFLNILGYEKDEMLERNYLDNVHVDYHENIGDLINNILYARMMELPDKIQYKAVTQNNDNLWVKMEPSIIHYNKKPALLGEINKITLAHKAFQDFDQNLKNIKDDHIIFYIINKEGKFLFISDTINKLGWEPENLIGKHFSNILHPEDVEDVASSTVLPKYKNVITGDSMAPKLFDERRTGDRKTENLEVRLIKNSDHNTEDQAELRYTPTIVDAAGLYTSQVSSYQKKQIGTVGIIREQPTYA